MPALARERRPYPGLSNGPREIVEADFGMADGVTVIDVRASLLWHYLKRFGIEGDAAAKPPQGQHIVMLNQEQVTAFFASRQEA
ncbi:MAG: hypothetical protein AB7U38_10715 [Hyphomicrobiales bacterium]